jgi:hypothetical protein
MLYSAWHGKLKYVILLKPGPYWHCVQIIPKYITVAGNGTIVMTSYLTWNSSYTSAMQLIRRRLSRIHIPQSFRLRTIYVDECVHSNSHTLHIKTANWQKNFQLHWHYGHHLENFADFQHTHMPPNLFSFTVATCIVLVS